MTGFGSLYYTDCVPGQGLQGGAGFQFQAASPGLASEAMTLVQRAALYEAPVSWMRDRRPVEDYPRSLAHTCEDGLFVTAAGRYLGKEANGSREGNQFTHAVVTRDAADYGMLRPAQLWGASWWATAPAAGVELDELPAVPADVPLGLETVHERIRAVDGAEEMLTALVSAVERLADPETRCPVVLVTADPERAACWIAAATMLRPQPDAVRVGFKIFVADAHHGRHDVIALHPEWAGRSADTAAGSGLMVFDLDRGRRTPAEPTESARFWVRRFLRADDPFDVQDAVELAGQLARARTDEPGPVEEVERLVAAVVAMDEPLTAPELQATADWLLDGPSSGVDLVRDQVLDAVLAAEPPARALRTLLAAAQTRGWAAAVSLRAGLLAAEIDEALAAADGVAATVEVVALPPLTPYAPGSVDPTAEREAVERLEAVLQDARPDQVPALLTVAARHGVRPDPNRFNIAADAFAGWWIERAGRPEVAGLDLRTWRAVPEAVDLVRNVLHQQMRSADRLVATRAVQQYWWEHLLPDSHDPADPLDAEVFRVAYDRLTPDRAAARALVNRVIHSARPVDRTPRDVLAWQALFGSEVPRSPAACDFLLGLKSCDVAMSRQVGAWIIQSVEHEPGLTEDSLWVIAELDKNRFPLPGRLAAEYRRDDRLLRTIDSIERGDGRSLVELADALEATPRELLDIRADDLTRSLLDAPPETAVGVLLSCSRTMMNELTRRIEQRWPGQVEQPDGEGCRALALTFLLVTDPHGESRKKDLGALRDLLEAKVKPASKVVRGAVNNSYDPPLGEPWWVWIEEIDAGRFKRFLQSENRPRLGRRGRSSDPGERSKPKAEGPSRKGWNAGRGGA